jgi:hypothetical protein
MCFAMGIVPGKADLAGDAWRIFFTATAQN